MTYKVYTIETDKNTAIEKNKILKEAREFKYDYCFFVQNDLEVDETIYEKYIDLMDTYKTSIIMYGYYSKDNRLFNGLPNPSMNIKVSDTETIQIYRRISRALVGICLKDNDRNFNEDLKVYELEDYIKVLEIEGKLPLGNGFFLDVPESWNYIKQKEGNYPTCYTAEMIQADKKYFDDNKITFSVESNIDELMDKLLKLRNM